jgi:ketosteroid isomerase-like protein
MSRIVPALSEHWEALTSMTMTERLDTWMDDYVLAWSSNDADHIRAIFTDDAVYDPQTADGEWEGIDEIVERWQEIGDVEDNWDFEWRPVVETDDLAVINGRTNYFEPPMSYRNLFVIRFRDDGRCYDFTEWYIEEEVE